MTDENLKTGRILIDVTNLLRVPFVTGIQRAAQEIILSVARICPERLLLLFYDEMNRGYATVDTARFIAHFSGRRPVGNPTSMVGRHMIDIRAFGAGDVFFDLDSAWNCPCPRSLLLPVLRGQGVRLVVYIYDLIPVRYPQYCYYETTLCFLEYLGAWLQHGDAVITSTAAVLEDTRKLAEELQLSLPAGGVSWLGADADRERQQDAVTEDLHAVTDAGPYLLYVGTIEPRKHVEFLLDVFERELFEENLHLVLAGRTGWDVEELEQRLRNHPEAGKRLHWLEGLTDTQVDTLYRHALAVVSATEDEGFGLPIIEAYERGIPVIVTDRPVLREVGGDLAEYFPPGDAQAFAALAGRLMTDASYRESRIENIRKSYRRTTWDEVARRVLAVLDAKA